MTNPLLPGLRQFNDTCNVYVVSSKKESIAIDFGSGTWLNEFEASGLPPLTHVFLTHHHPDQCAGLESASEWPFAIHASSEEEPFLSPQGVEQFWAQRRAGGVPRSYAVLPAGIPGITYDTEPWTEIYWGRERLRFIATPGHSRGAITILANIGAKQVAFCGDAAHTSGTIHKPYHLEWDHWTADGVRAAQRGIECLRALKIHLLAPAHGPIIHDHVARELTILSRRLLRLGAAKGSICAGEPDRYHAPRFTPSGARIVVPGLYQFGSNSYLLHSDTGEAMMIDPYLPNMDLVPDLLAELDVKSVSLATATHYHSDHTDGLPRMRSDYEATIVLHPWVAEPLRDLNAMDVPWLPTEPIHADSLMPEEGEWTWNEFTFQVAPLPGQTWWHCGLMTDIAGKRVLISGDSFQPASRWNGTGGFCAFNGSHFSLGFKRSAEQIIKWAPDLLAAGHGTYFRFSTRYFQKVIKWATEAEEAMRELCPSGDLDQDYYLHDHSNQCS